MLKKAAVSAEALAHVLDQSVDCVKLLDLDGTVIWMNTNGLCAMEIDDFGTIAGLPWGSLWPQDARDQITASLTAARKGETVKFNAFCPTAKGTPRWWDVTVSAVTGVDGDSNGFLSISRDVTAPEQQRRALQIAAEEMRHRLRNTYAMVGSLMKGFARGNTAHEEFAKTMQARLMSLAAAQSLSAAVDAPCRIVELIPALIEPFKLPSCKVSMDRIDDVSVAHGEADAIALVIGELAVNSAKHGALAHGGSIDLRAEVDGPDIRIVWTETSDAQVTKTSRTGGQGLNLIERIVAVRNGLLHTDWQSHGPVVSLTFPYLPGV